MSMMQGDVALSLQVLLGQNLICAVQGFQSQGTLQADYHVHVVLSLGRHSFERKL